MLHELRDLHGDAIEATDGQIGHVVEVYFDDKQWAIRYLVVKTGSWLDTRDVLLSPISLGEQHWEQHTLSANLTKDKVKNCPSIEVHKPVSRQQEVSYNEYFGWKSYWGGNGLWASWETPMLMATPTRATNSDPVIDPGDPHLRSSREITGYHLQATDTTVGHIADFIIDDETWAIRYLVVDTSNWGFGHDVLIAPEWIKGLHAETRTVEVLVPRDVITDSPRWNPDVPITRAYEDGLRTHYRDRQARSRDPQFLETPISPRPHRGA